MSFAEDLLFVHRHPAYRWTRARDCGPGPHKVVIDICRGHFPDTPRRMDPPGCEHFGCSGVTQEEAYRDAAMLLREWDRVVEVGRVEMARLEAERSAPPADAQT